MVEGHPGPAPDPLSSMCARMSIMADSPPTLRIVRGRNAGQRYVVDKERFVIGRRKGDLIVQDPEVSGTHAEIIEVAAGWILRDLGSTNGSYVNGDLVRESLLAHNDELGLGRTVLVWEAPDKAADTPERSESSSRGRIPVGIFDALPDYAGLGLLVRDELSAFSDPEGTALMDFRASDVQLKLPAKTEVQLEIVEGPEKGRIEVFKSGAIHVGRFGTDIVIKDSDISRRHLSITVFGRDQIFLRDLGSTNGSYVNGVRVLFCKLQSGDTVVAGRTVMRLNVRELDRA